jgi:hypothetical protein
MAMKEAWKSSWKAFVRHVAELRDQGAGDSEISESLGGTRIRWRGTVRNLQLDAEYSPGADLEMPPVELRLRNGKSVEASHLPIKVNRETIASWKSVRSGDEVEFEGRIAGGSGPFPGIEVAEDDAGNVATLMMMVEEASVVEPARG